MHAEMLTTLEGEMLFDYLMSSMVYLKTEDLEGWKEQFLSKEQAEVVVKPKNLRQSPNAAPYVPLPLCEACGGDEVIDDVPQGQYVCTTCGLIQKLGVFSGGPAHCSMDRLMNTARVHIHRYSRIVHFRTTIRLMQGDSCPEMDPATLLRLRTEIDGNGLPVTVDLVSKALRKLGLARKFRRHRCRIAELLGHSLLPTIPAAIVMDMLKLFRRLEYYWGFYHAEIAPKRKVFLSYRFVFYQFAHQLGHPELTGSHHLLKNERLSQFQFDSYARASKHTGFPVHL